MKRPPTEAAHSLVIVAVSGGVRAVRFELTLKVV